MRVIEPGSQVVRPYYLARDIVTQMFSIYALKMAAVFLLSQATLWLRTKVMPRWITYLTFLAGLVLLFVFSQSFWAVLVFPAWVFLVSVYILVGTRFRRRHAAAEAATPDATDPGYRRFGRQRQPGRAMTHIDAA